MHTGSSGSRTASIAGTLPARNARRSAEAITSVIAIAAATVDAAERDGLLRPGGTIVEGTSGNTGVGLALVALQRGYRMVFVVRDKFAGPKVATLRGYGAEVVVTPTRVEPADPRSYYSVDARLAAEIPGAFNPNQFANRNGFRGHFETTGPEIWDDTDGRVPHFVTGIGTDGTDGTITETGRFLKRASDGRVRIIGADPEGSIYSGGPIHGYQVEGVGEDFLPTTFDPAIVDGYERISDAESFAMTRRLAAEEGLFVGGSSGMAVVAALRTAAALDEDDVVVVLLLPDHGRGYLDKLYRGWPRHPREEVLTIRSILYWIGLVNVCKRLAHFTTPMSGRFPMFPLSQRMTQSSTARRIRTGGLALALAAGALIAPAALAPAHADPPASPGPLAEGDVIYQVLVDRFSDGDPTNNDQGDGEYDPSDLGFYHGGDWAGLTGKLDYIADLGVTAIWLSPVSDQQPLSRDGLEASYHGYFTRDFATPNAHFGDTAELQELIDTAHGLGLKMILDVVPNHTADYLAGTSTTYSPSTYKPASPLDNSSYFHHAGDCLFDGSESQTQIEDCDLGGLDDLDQSNPTVSNYLIDTYKDWIDMGFDGIRVDAARSIPKPWLEDFEDAMGVPTFGEVFVGDVDYVSEYQDYEWGVLDFPYFFTVRSAFAADTDMNALGDLFDQDVKYANPNRLETFLDNHDRARFLTWADDNYQRLRSALTFQLTSRGVPVIYYGTEQADDGNGNPYEVPIANKDNRKDMTSWDQNAPIYTHIQRLTAIKAAYPALQIGTQREMWSDTNVYGFSRRVDATGAEAVVLSSNSWTTQTRTVPLRAESTISVGTVLTNLMNTSDTVTVAAGGPTGKQIVVSLGEHESKVYAPGAPVSSYSPAARNTTKIRVHYSVGLGHTIALRGDAYPFTWTDGRGARNVAPDVWEFEVERIPNGQSFQFKPLIDDVTWSTGSNFTGTGGDVIDIYPAF